MTLVFTTMLAAPPHGYASTSLDGAYLYYIEVYVSYEPESEPIVYKGYLSIVVENGGISSVRITATRDTYGSYVPPIFEDVVKKWIEGLKFITVVSSGAKTYMSIGDKIVAAYIVRGGSSVEYREARTGVYLGGFSKFQMPIPEYFRRVRYTTIYVTVVTYIVEVDPPSITSQFEIVEPPTDNIRLFGLVIAIGIVAGAALTIVRWDKYNLDIFMR